MEFQPNWLAALNTATQYPSIQTYHELGDRGILQESGNPFAGLDEPVYVTEKVDGANGRIIFWEGDWIIGSRTELLAAKGDRIWPQANAIVDTLRPYAMRGNGFYGSGDPDSIWVIYAEVYGHRSTQHYGLYSDGDFTGARLFDIARIDAGVLDSSSLEKIAAWRERDVSRFTELDAPSACGILPVPHLDQRDCETLPKTVGEMAEYMEDIAGLTKATLLEDVPPRRPEGIVLRTKDRTVIRKARYESYDKTIRLAGAR